MCLHNLCAYTYIKYSINTCKIGVHVLFFEVQHCKANIKHRKSRMSSTLFRHKHSRKIDTNVAVLQKYRNNLIFESNVTKKDIRIMF